MRLRVHGPRLWRARTRKSWRGLLERGKEDIVKGWDLTDGDPVNHVPIDWRLAFGGRIEGGEQNPVGIGLLDEAHFHKQPEWPAPWPRSDPPLPDEPARD
jgi:hypothetical protein